MERTSSVYVQPPLLEFLAHKRAIITSINHGLPQVIGLSTSSKVPGHSVIGEENDPSERKVKLRLSV